MISEEQHINTDDNGNHTDNTNREQQRFCHYLKYTPEQFGHDRSGGRTVGTLFSLD